MGEAPPVEHMRDMMMLIALGGAVTYGWKENFCRCAITASSFWSKTLLSQPEKTHHACSTMKT